MGIGTGGLTATADRELDEIMQLAHKAGLAILPQQQQLKSAIAAANTDDHKNQHRDCEKRIVRDLSSLPLLPLPPSEQQQQQQQESTGHYNDDDDEDNGGGPSAPRLMTIRSSAVVVPSSSMKQTTSRSKALIDEILSSVPVAQLRAILSLSPPTPVKVLQFTSLFTLTGSSILFCTLDSLSSHHHLVLVWWWWSFLVRKNRKNLCVRLADSDTEKYCNLVILTTKKWNPIAMAVVAAAAAAASSLAPFAN